jgi:GWxTD domain-containing protein
MIVSLALAPTNLSFRRDGDQHRADYRVTLTVRRGDNAVARIEAAEPVRVPGVREARSTDESIIFQQLITLAPGAYSLTVAVADDGSGRRATTESAVTLPRLAAGGVSRPVVTFEVVPRASRDSLPRIVSNPRATVTFGRDTTIPLYLEAYGFAENHRIGLAIQVESVTVWSGFADARAANGDLFTAIEQIPVLRFAPGAAFVAAWIPGVPDTVKTPVFVSMGDAVPATTYADMISYLRYFAAESRIRPLLAATPASRANAWTTFYRETDPDPTSTHNDSLASYLERVRHVEAQFREGNTPGWRTDRGTVWLLLGPFDQAVDPLGSSPDRSERGRAVIWEYRSLDLSVEFIRAATFDQWRLTPESESKVFAIARRLLGGEVQR